MHRTGQKTTYGFIMACIELYATGKSYHTEEQGFGYPWLAKKIPAEAEPSSERSAYPLQKYICFSLLTSVLESFGHKSTPSDRPWIEAYCPTF